MWTSTYLHCPRKLMTTDNSLTIVQRKLLEMLSAFIDICESNNLVYYLIGGSLIGAIRHGGFIPWDDDIDIGMPRPDYEKFIHLSTINEKTKDYYVMYGVDSGDFVFSYAKFVDKKSILVEKTHNIRYGLYIDIFPLDGCGNSFGQYRFNYYRFFWHLGILNNIQYKEKRYGLKRLFQLYSKRHNAAEEFEKLEKISKKYLLNNSRFFTNYSGRYGLKEFGKKDWLGEPRKTDFNGINVSIPNDYDSYLRSIYGDYMVLPPIEKRISPHNRAEVVFLDGDQQ